MNKIFKSLFSLALLVMVALTGFTAAAASGDEPVASVIIWPKGIEWQPHVFFDQLVLTVSGPGDAYFQQTFPADTAPVFDLLDNGGVPFPDGSCTYELSVVPDIPPEVFPSPSDGRGPLDGVQEAGSKEPERGLVQSGAFSIQGGEIVTGSEAEEGKKEDFGDSSTRNPDFVINDDLIVDGSTCIGFDCVNGEQFGFDTIRLKENNLRIKFDDTSVAASYPRNDWQLTANDSANGGLSKFSIDDITGGRTPFTVEAGAPSHSLYVEDYGRVGLGTSVPYVELHIVDGDSPTVRLDQDGSSGWAAQKWDLCGNETNFFLRDVTNGSKLCFRVQPNTPSNTLCLRSTGNVGVGTWSPDFPLEVERTGENASVVVNRTDGATNYVNATDSHANTGSVSNHPLRLVTNSVWRMRINTDGTLDMSDGGSYDGTWNDASSRVYKENIESLSTEKAMVALNGLNPVQYNYKTNKEEARVGFIAEEVPDLVARNGRKDLSTMDILAVLTKVVKEQQKTISVLNKRITELERKSQADSTLASIGMPGQNKW